MTGAPIEVVDLLAQCAAHGIRLCADDNGGLAIDAPQDALTPELLDRLKAHKAELLTLLQPNAPAARESTISNRHGLSIDLAERLPERTPASIALVATTCERRKPVCRCGSMGWREVLIHGGQSVRRDCDQCGRFIEFSVWYGKNASNERQVNNG